MGRRRAAEEKKQMRAIWSAASDYLLGLDVPEFAEEFGGIDKLKSDLAKAVSAYEDG